MKRTEPREGVLEEFSFDKFRLKPVEVVADRMIYHGIFLGADDNTIYLKGNLRFLLLPMSQVRSLRLQGEKGGFDALKSVSKDFYSDDPGADEVTDPS
ncbi:MAG: hypothetical protein JRF33_03410 [Deltaproteobacteria bacterium]|nr:hypothetical protein [Deltaproteobacteria bacterium]